MRAVKGVQILRLLSLLLASAPSHGNFFTRMIKLGNRGGEETAKQPTGAQIGMGSDSQVGSVISVEDGVALAILSNRNKFPLVGLGAGHLNKDRIPELVSEALQDDKMTRLIDTSHASKTENLVAQGILEGVERLSLKDGEKLQVHVVTKVWYTHLGYERSKLSVKESMDAFQPVINSDKVDLKIHLLLHWPRCFDQIPWMDCEQDEEDLPQHVKDAGPAPHKNPDSAWRESWKLLEDIYLSDEFPIASIGVSNFQLKDLEEMATFARIQPHVLQVNAWSLLYDSFLTEYCHKHRIHVQVYGALRGTMKEPENAPNAYHHLQKIAIEIQDSGRVMVTPAQLVLAWFVQHGVSVIPGTSKLERLNEYSTLSLMSVPSLTDLQVETVAHAVEAYLSGDDLEQKMHVSLTFHAVNKDIVIYWLANTDEFRVALVRKGEVFNETTYPNHVFRSYDAQNKDVFVDHLIKANFGDHKNIYVEV